MNATVTSVSLSGSHSFSKPARDRIALMAGLGIEGDAHCGEKVKHRSRVARDPNQPNLRQVHLMHSELFDELAARGYTIAAGQLGENVTTRGIALLDLPRGTLLHLGATAVVQVTGLRNPCPQIDRFRQGLRAAVLGRAADGGILRKTGVLSIVLAGGSVAVGDAIGITLPAGAHLALEPV